MDKMAVCRYLLLFLSMIAMMSFASSDISVENTKCEMDCALNYSQNEDEIGYCRRGCRLMRLADFTNYGFYGQNTRDLLQTCSDSCAKAYGGQSSMAASNMCQSGCKLELPAVDNRLHQLQMFYNEQSKYIQMFDMINKLMSCHLQSFMYGPQLPDRSYDRYFRARVVFISNDGGSVRSISMSRDGSDTNMKTEHHEVASSVREPTGRMLEGKSRLYTRINRSDPAIVVLFLFGLVLLIGLTVSLCYPAQHTPAPSKSQKLSIYGDGDFLSTLDEDDTLIDIKPRAELFVAAPLPTKHAL